MNQNYSYLPINKLFDLTGQVAIVTGGAKGIGLGIVRRLSEAGAALVIADLDEDEGRHEVDELNNQGQKAAFIKTDVSQREDIKKMVDLAVSSFGQLNILVNNAGIYPFEPLLEMSEEEWEKVLHVNLKSVYLTTKVGAQQMIKQGQGGRIINITSIDALHPSSVGLGHYDASKHGVWGFTKETALELAPHKIWVNAIAPGGILTPGVKKSASEEILQAFIKKIPMQRLGDPDEIGKAALFLASDTASYMTGTQVVVDGGVLLA